MPGIFICYRRDDSAGFAGRLYDGLTQHFGRNMVFMDVDDIQPGVNFVDVIQEVVARARAVVVVIGKQWLNGGDPFGRRRLGDKDDFVRLEIRAALQRKGVAVVPVLVHGATMPAQYDLPDELRDLTRRNAIELRHTTWTSDVQKLVRALEKVVGRPGRTTARKRSGGGRKETPAPGGKSTRSRGSGKPAEKATEADTGDTKKRMDPPPARRAGTEQGSTPPVKKQPAKQGASSEKGGSTPKKKNKPPPKVDGGAAESTPRAGAAPAKARKPVAKTTADPKQTAKTGAARKKAAGAGAGAAKKTPTKSAGTTRKRRKR
ncbi:MAG: TIR domain-containing protein [Longimicrobiaceae bacterium]